MTLGQVKVRTGTDFALVTDTIRVTCIPNRVRPVCLRTWVVDVALVTIFPTDPSATPVGVFVSSR